MELQCGGEAEAVDLSGDAGVVGRWLVQGDEDNPQLCMDLKGVLFSATTVRLFACRLPGCGCFTACAVPHDSDVDFMSASYPLQPIPKSLLMACTHSRGSC